MEQLAAELARVLPVRQNTRDKRGCLLVQGFRVISHDLYGEAEPCDGEMPARKQKERKGKGPQCPFKGTAPMACFLHEGSTF